MFKKVKFFLIITLSVAIMLGISFNSYAIGLEPAGEDNPIVEVTEHGFSITESCAKAIEEKLYIGDIVSGCVFDDGEITLSTNDFIAPYEFGVIEEYVDIVEGYPEFNLYIVHCDSSLSIRETAALFAEDERVIRIHPHSWEYLCIDDPNAICFQDIEPGAYYHSAVYWAGESKIANGYSRLEFGVGKACTRKDFLIFLWRMEGGPEVENAECSFNDMSAYSTSSDTYKAITWAVSEGIVKGYGDGGFHPTETIKRKDALIMMFRAFGSKVPKEVAFPDVLALGCSKESDTYCAIAWAEEMGITHGYSDNSFRPLEDCLREQAITFLYRAACKGY